MLRIGSYEVHSIVTGTIRLDGGAMFGVVPKVLWEKCVDVDGSNRILLATRTLLAVDRAHGRIVLVDTGCGTKWPEEQARRYAIAYDRGAVAAALSGLDLAESDVTDVIITHLHFDHNGGLTDWYDEPGERTQLRYPQARHWIHRKQWEHAHQPYVKDRASFLPRDFAILSDHDRLILVEGEHPPAPFEGVEWFVSQGHTPYQLHPIFGGDQEKLLFAGDIVPTVAHLRLGWVMAYDVEPLMTIEEKKAIFQRSFSQGLWIAFPHDPEIGGVAIDGTVERPIVSRSLGL